MENTIDVIKASSNQNIFCLNYNLKSSENDKKNGKDKRQK